MKITSRLALYFSVGAVLFLNPTHEAYALRLKLKQPADSTNRIVVATASDAAVATGRKATVNIDGKTGQLAVLTDSGTLSVVVGYKRGKKLLPAKKVLNNPEKFCSSDNIKAYTAVKGKGVTLNLQYRDEGDIAYHKGRLGGKRGLKKKSLKGLVNVDSNCLPSGTGLSLGLGTNETSSLLARVPQPLDTDQDADGMLDLFDIDTDDDSIINNYDSSTATPPEFFKAFSVFSNLKVGLVDTLNVNALGANPTKAQVDALTEKTTLAVEVKASTGEESELDCTGLSYCTAGGTGTTGNPTAAFPGTAGGTYDADSDGLGTIEAGGTGDFQLNTNLSEFNEANAGDAFAQTVSDSVGTVLATYLANLQFVFRATPALETLALDPDGANQVTNFTYPITEGDAGTNSNCIEVSPNGDGDIILEYVAWRPQRAGVAALGEADFVDLGNSKIAIDIPNEPTVGGTPGNGVGNCPASSYTESDANLTIGADSLEDSLGDTDADVANKVTFRVDLTACLASGGQVLDSGEQVDLDLQFFNDAGDNAAQKLCVERP